MGLFVEAIAIGMKGVVKREDLPAGDWYFDAARLRFTSRAGGEFRSGQAVPLRVGKVDFARKFVDFTIAGEPRDPRSKGERSSKEGGRSQGARGKKPPQAAIKRGKESVKPTAKKARQGEAPKTEKPPSRRRRR